ncbi:MAG: ABC transporter substrate-binding protein [Sphaerochaetaceae bacterium]
MKLKLSRILLTLVCVFLVSLPLVAQGVAESSKSSEVRTAIDSLGREVSVSGDLERILVVGRAAVMPADALFLFPAAKDMEIVLAKTDQGLGDYFDLIRPEYRITGRLGQQVGAEEIIAQEPDLVLTKSSNYDSVVALLEPFGIPVFVMDLETPQAWKSEIVELGRLLDDAETPRRTIEAFEIREQAVDTAIATLDESQRPGVLMMQAAASDGVTAFSVSPKDWIQTSITLRAGGKPVWMDANLAANSWRKVSFEQIAAWNPANIFLISYKSPASAFLQAIDASPQWQQLAATRTGSIGSTPADVMNYFQSDSRWILALQWLAAELHPTLFPDFDMEVEIRSFYTDFYGIESEEILGPLVDAYRSSVIR